MTPSRGVIQKSIARKQAHFSSLDVAAKVIFPEFAQVSLLAGLREPAIMIPTYGYVIVENYHTDGPTMHNIFLPPMLLCARLRLAKLPTDSFHIFIFQTYIYIYFFFSSYNLTLPPPPTLGVLLNTPQPSFITCQLVLTIVAKSIMSRLRDTQILNSTVSEVIRTNPSH